MAARWEQRLYAVLWTQIPHPHASPARPHFEPGHVTLRSAWLLIWNESGYEKSLKCWQRVCYFYFFVLRQCLLAHDSLNSIGTVKKHHLLPAQFTFCKLAPDWPGEIQRRLWLAESVLLTEGGLPESRERWKLKFSASELHHAPPLSGFGIITGKPFVLGTILNYDNAWPSWSYHAMILLCFLAFMDNLRRSCPPIMTLRN